MTVLSTGDVFLTIAIVGATVLVEIGVFILIGLI
jgi:hypothetical protein